MHDSESRCRNLSWCSRGCGGTVSCAERAGRGGGYGLARSAAGITVADIVQAGDGPVRPVNGAADRPSGNGRSPDQRIASDGCADLERETANFLASVSLQDLVEAQCRLGLASMSAARDSCNSAINHR